MFNPIRMPSPHFIFYLILKCEMELRENEFCTHSCAHRLSGEQKTYKLKKKSIVTVLLLFFNLKKKSMEEKKVLHLHSTLQCEFFKDKDMDENGVILL